MLPASRAACVPVFMATPTSAWASAGASLVPSPHMATSLPFACSPRMSLSLSSGVACGEKVVDAGFSRDRRGGQRVVAGDHDGADAHAPQLGEALADAAFDDVLEVNDAEQPCRSRRPASGVPPDLAISSAMALISRSLGEPLPTPAPRPAVDRDSRGWRRPRPCESRRRRCRRRSCGVCAVNGMNLACELLDVAPANAVFLLGEHDDASGLRASRRQARRAAPHRPAPSRRRL